MPRGQTPARCRGLPDGRAPPPASARRRQADEHRRSLEQPVPHRSSAPPAPRLDRTAASFAKRGPAPAAGSDDVAGIVPGVRDVWGPAGPGTRKVSVPTAPATMPDSSTSASPPASHAGVLSVWLGAPSRRRIRCTSDPPLAAMASSAAGSAQLFEIGQRPGVGDRIAAEADREIVAAVLALDADPPREPPDRGVIEQECLDQRLQEVDQVVVTADVRELVRENRLELLRRSPASALAGSSITGLSQPITVGTSTRVDSSSVTARRCAAGATAASQRSATASAARCVPVRFQCAAPRSTRSAAAALSTTTPRDPDEHESRQPRFEPRDRRRSASLRATPLAGRRPPARAAQCGSARSRRCQRRTATAAAVARRRRPASAPHWNCIAVTTGSVSISDRPIVRDDVADVGGAAAQQPERERGDAADERALPDEVQQRPADSLGRRLAQQGLNRAHLGLPARSRLRRRSALRISAQLFRRMPASWRAPA